jgi:hypothetical protein
MAVANLDFLRVDGGVVGDAEEEISYLALAKGTAVHASSGTRFGTVEHVLQVPELDLFDGIVVRVHRGLRFVDREQIAKITRTVVHCDLSDADVAALPRPSGPPVEGVDAFQDVGPSLTARLGRMFGREHWIEKR